MDSGQNQQTTEQNLNRLARETSPYLLQHADNPVDWYPWGEEAFEKAHAEDKPIFLSIGYAACHWCHVMEHESFENDAIAAVLNEHFVSIKVDREERPDVDEIYMTAVQALTGSGGWPLTVFLTPDLKPFFGGTYFPPQSAFGRPGFQALLEGIVEAWNARRNDVILDSDRVAAFIARQTKGDATEREALDETLLTNAASSLISAFDPQNGGFGAAPKFPPAAAISFLLHQYAQRGDAYHLEMAAVTLDKMAQGGLYDHLGGGFHRYATDARWLVPHFEKMLYDNAQLAAVYLEAYQATRNPFYRRVAEETFDYVLRDMQDPAGAFYSSEDADSEGQEGKFYLWTQQEIFHLLGEKDGRLFCACYGVRKNGNFNSHEPYHAKQNTLHIAKTARETAESFGLTAEALEEKLASLRRVLFDARAKRARPGLDDKILTAWNGLMISAFAHGAQVLDEPRYREAAERAAQFILTNMADDTGGLLRSHRHGRSRFPAYLNDYAFLSAALVDLYEATFDVKWLDAAARFTEAMIERFWDPADGAFFFTSREHANLIVRTKPSYDGALPSGNAVAALTLLRLAVFLDNGDYRDKARHILETNRQNMQRAPRGFLNMIAAADFMLHPPREIAIAGRPETEHAKALLRALHSCLVPNKIVALIDPSGENATPIAQRVPLLASKTTLDGKAAAYVCENYTCKSPVTSPDALLNALGAPPQPGAAQ